MSSLRKGRVVHKSGAPNLPLFDYANEVRIRELSLIARRLASRWQMSPATARAYAGLAGYPTERDR